MTQETPDVGSRTMQEAVRAATAQVAQAMFKTPNQIRKAMGLPPIPHRRQIFHIEGETDLNAQLKHVLKTGETYRLHHHKAEAPCNRLCVTHYEGKEDDEPTETP